MIDPEELRFSRRMQDLAEPHDARARRDEARTPRPRSAGHGRVKRASRAVGAVAVVLGGAVAVPGLLSRDAADVASIAREPAYQDPALIARAFALPVAAAYARGGLDHQRNPTFCGPATAVDVARSLGVPADQSHVLDGTGVRAPLGILWGGMTLDEEARVLRQRTGRRVTILRDLGLPRFREELSHANDPGRRYTVNFSRAPLFGRGGGHHSPIGAYLPDRDLVLVLDVNRGFGPWLVPAERLYRAVDTVDRATGRKRGLLRIE